jgi:hypothetical protein
LTNHLLVLSFALLVATYAFNVKAATCCTPSKCRVTGF